MMSNDPKPIPVPATGSVAAPAAEPSTSPRADEAPAGALAGHAEMRSRELLDKVVRTAHHSIDRLAETAAPRLDKIEQGVAGAADALQARGEQWRDTGDAWTESLRKSVRDHPLAALALAVAAGMLIARLSDR